MKGERLNVIYPTNDLALFVHAYPNFEGGRGFYVVIEPDIAQDLETLKERVDTRLLDLTHISQISHVRVSNPVRVLPI